MGTSLARPAPPFAVQRQILFPSLPRAPRPRRPATHSQCADFPAARALTAPTHNAPSTLPSRYAPPLFLPPLPQCIILDPLLSGADLAASLDMLAKLAVRVSGGGSVLQLVEEARRLTL